MSYRLHRRFPVENGVVTFSQRGPLGLGWRKPSTPLPIRDMSLRGVLFVGLSAPLVPGTYVRLVLNVQDFPSFSVKGRVVRNAPLGSGNRNTTSRMPWACAVEFTSYDERTWALLRSIEARANASVHHTKTDASNANHSPLGTTHYAACRYAPDPA